MKGIQFRKQNKQSRLDKIIENNYDERARKELERLRKVLNEMHK